MSAIPQTWLPSMQSSARVALTTTTQRFYLPSPSYVQNLDRFSRSIFMDPSDLPGEFTLEMAHFLAYQQLFQNCPSINALAPLAKKLWKTKNAFERAVIGAPVGGVQPPQVVRTLREFIQVHAEFETRFTEKIMELTPYEPFTVGKRYPKIVNHFKQAFEEIKASKRQIAECDPEYTEKVGHLGLLICLRDKELDLSSLFSKENLQEIVNVQKILSEIADFQSFYEGFLVEEFPPSEIHLEVYKQISALFYKMDRRISAAIRSLLFFSVRN